MYAFIQAVQRLLHLFSSKVIFLTFQMFVSGQTRKKIYLPLRCVCVYVQSLSHVRLFATLWTLARQTSLSMRFFRQEYWSGLSRRPPGDLPNSKTEPASLMSPALAGGFFTISATWEALSVPYGI